LSSTAPPRPLGSSSSGSIKIPLPIIGDKESGNNNSAAGAVDDNSSSYERAAAAAIEDRRLVNLTASQQPRLNGQIKVSPGLVEFVQKLEISGRQIEANTGEPLVPGLSPPPTAIDSPDGSFASASQNILESDISVDEHVLVYTCPPTLVPTKISFRRGDNSRKELKQSLYEKTKVHFYSFRNRVIK
jgi:hypothetical protein